jgi:hypothetical protein
MEPSMRLPVIVGFLVLVAVSGCASMKATSTSARPDAAQGMVPAVSGPQSISPPPPAETPEAASATPAPAPASAATGSSPAKAKSSTDTRPTKQAGAAAARARPPAAQTATSDKPAIPPAPSSTLNLTDLEQRLRDTRAIGLFTKLSLKNQVDDLLNAFRELYRGPNKQPPPELRQRYDQLLLKVLTLLQDGDPPLAAAIASSREAIWSILADPDKFAKI